ncbi:hypothetical protein AGF18_29295 (plasmid) [Klebsiella oxytoca]|nr:hypothetical protein AGF18_29295 [Klebsiella oxytoca]GCX68597.1 transposase [Escherichia coli]
MQAALDYLREQGETVNDEDVARLSPLCYGHINMLGHYSFTLAELVTKGHLRPLKGVVSENGIYGHSRFCNTDFDDKLACLNLSGV